MDMDTVTDGATLITDGVTQVMDGATQDGVILVTDIHTMDTTTLITTEEEVLQVITETETTLTTEITALIEDTQPIEERIQLIETTLPTEEATQLIEEALQITEATTQIDPTVILTSEELAQIAEQQVQHLQIEDHIQTVLTTATAITTAPEDLIIAETAIPQQIEATPLATTAVHQEVILQAALAVQ